MDFKLIHVETTTSTNALAKELLKVGKEPLPDFTVIAAEEQTAGKGLGTNTWESEQGKNLTFSLICHPRFVKPYEQFVISQAMAMAVWEAVVNLRNETTQFSVKWPNDIYFGDKKLCGTLIECTLQGGEIHDCVIGVGLNVNQTVFCSDAPNPVSLTQIYGMTFDRDNLLHAIVEHFADFYERCLKGQRYQIIRNRYETLLYRRKGMHRYSDKNGEFWASFAGITTNGQLQLIKADGTEATYNFKEVSYLQT